MTGQILHAEKVGPRLVLPVKNLNANPRTFSQPLFNSHKVLRRPVPQVFRTNLQGTSQRDEIRNTSSGWELRVASPACFERRVRRGPETHRQLARDGLFAFGIQLTPAQASLNPSAVMPDLQGVLNVEILPQIGKTECERLRRLELYILPREVYVGPSQRVAGLQDRAWSPTP